MGKRIRAGNVVCIRVNPKDCMAVVDIIEKAGVYMQGMSFASMVSISLSSLIQTMKDHGVLEDRDGFDYLNVVGPYLKADQGRKLEITQAIQTLGSRFKISGLSKPIMEEDVRTPIIIDHSPDTPQMKEAKRILRELNDKRELSKISLDVTWSANDEEEWQKYHSIVYSS